MSEDKADQEQEPTNHFITVTDEAETLKPVESEDDKAASKEGDDKAKADDTKPDPDKSDKDKSDDPEGDKSKEDDPDKEDKSEEDKKDADSASDKRRQRRFDKRIARVTKRAKIAETRAEKAERELSQAKAELAEIKASSSKPKPEDFDDHDDYLKAHDKWKDGQKSDDKDEKDKPKSQAQIEFESALEDVTDSFAETQAKYKDFKDVVHNDELRITETMIIALADTEDAGEIAYYLGKHPDEAARIAEMNPVRQAAAIGKIEAKLAADDAEDSDSDPEKDKNKEPDKKPAKKVSKASDPVDPVKGNNSPEKKPEDMDFKEFEASRKTAGAKKFW